MAKTGWRRWLNGLSQGLLGGTTRRKPRPAPHRRLELERLEDRLVPALDLMVGTGTASIGVAPSVSGTTTTFTALRLRPC